MNYISLLIFALSFDDIVFSLIEGSAISQAPWEATKKNKKWWIRLHRQYLNTTASLGKDIKVLFIGSSSIEYWGTTGKEVWDSKYASLGAVNYGIRGDRTEHLLWRIEHGELDGLNPQLVVVYIGSNNVPRFLSEECVRGVSVVLDKIHEKLPNSNVLYVGFFPRGDRLPVKDTLLKIRNITDTLKPMIERDANKRTHFLDLFWSLAPPSMDRIYEEYYRADKLHQNLRGYRNWANLMDGTFNSLLEVK